MAGRCSIFPHRSAIRDRESLSFSLAAPAALETYTVVEPFNKNRERRENARQIYS